MADAGFLLLLLACAGQPDPEPNVAEVQTLPQRIGEPDLMSIDDIKAHRVELAQRMQTDPDPRVRADIASALGYTARDVDSIPALAEALRTERDGSVQRRLVAVLVSFQHPAATDAVVRFALGEVNEALLPEVHSALVGCDPGQVQAALAAHEPEHPEAVARLRAALCALLPSAVYCAG